jgi:GntR family phosphonate transport system transcriptional regulator
MTRQRRRAVVVPARAAKAAPAGSAAVPVLPAWRRIEAALQGEIASRAVAPGDRLPPEQDIAARFGVGRLTARRALASLQQQGFIRIEPGRGTFVQDTIFPYELAPQGRFCHYLESINVVPGRDLLQAGVVAADARVARELGLASGAAVVRLRVLGSADARPVLLAENFLSAGRFVGFHDAYARIGSITEALRLYGVEAPRRLRCEFISRMPDAEEARLLQQPRTRPVMELELTRADHSGRPIWFALTCFAGDRVRFIAAARSE